MVHLLHLHHLCPLSIIFIPSSSSLLCHFSLLVYPSLSLCSFPPPFPPLPLLFLSLLSVSQALVSHVHLHLSHSFNLSVCLSSQRRRREKGRSRGERNERITASLNSLITGTWCACVTGMCFAFFTTAEAYGQLHQTPSQLASKRSKNTIPCFALKDGVGKKSFNSSCQQQLFIHAALQKIPRYNGDKLGSALYVFAFHLLTRTQHKTALLGTHSNLQSHTVPPYASNSSRFFFSMNPTEIILACSIGCCIMEGFSSRSIVSRGGYLQSTQSYGAAIRWRIECLWLCSMGPSTPCTGSVYMALSCARSHSCCLK